MEYNLAGIRRRIAVDKLDDEEFNPDVIDNFINDTQRDIFNQYELPFQEKIFEGTIPQGVTMFKMPRDMAQIQSQLITSPSDGAQHSLSQSYMEFRDFNKLYPTPMNNQPGPISRWTLYGGSMITSSPTDQEYTMTMFYIRKPSMLSENDDIPEIPEEFSELLVLGAFQRIQEREGDYDQASMTEQKYNNLLNMLVARYGFRHASGPVKLANKQRITSGSFPLVRKTY